MTIDPQIAAALFGATSLTTFTLILIIYIASYFKRFSMKIPLWLFFTHAGAALIWFAGFIYNMLSMRYQIHHWGGPLLITFIYFFVMFVYFIYRMLSYNRGKLYFIPWVLGHGGMVASAGLCLFALANLP